VTGDKSIRNNKKVIPIELVGCGRTNSFYASWMKNAPKGWNDSARFMPSSLHQWLKANNLH
jgi:hypothetical protein